VVLVYWRTRQTCRSGTAVVLGQDNKHVRDCNRNKCRVGIWQASRLVSAAHPSQHTTPAAVAVPPQQLPTPQ